LTHYAALLLLQVRGAAAATAEREARALAALERSGAERNAAAAARERLLQEREDAVSGGYSYRLGRSSSCHTAWTAF
jgi:sirohydrochlorin ferrochelatase